MSTDTLTIRDMLNAHPLYAPRLRRLAHRASRVSSVLGPVSAAECLALEAYLLGRPERFFSRDVFSHVSALLQMVCPTSLLIPGNITTEAELNEALSVVRRTNRALGDPQRESYRDEKRQQVLTEEIFPDYARLAEYAYGALVGYVAELQALARHKPYVKPLAKGKDVSPLRSRWDVAKRWLPSSFYDCFHPNIRNAIIHASLLFDEFDVRFADPSGPEIVLPLSDAEDLTANVLDVCNGIAAAIVLHTMRVEAATSRAPTLRVLRTQRVLSASSTDLLHSESCFESVTGRKAQLQVEGTHSHWSVENLLFDVLRTLAFAKHYFPEAQQLFVSYSGPRRSPTFYSIPTTVVPDLDEPVSALSSLFKALGNQGMSMIEHEGIASALVSKLRGVGATINWLNSVPFTMTLDPTREPEFELRELLDVSVGVRERFHAVIVSEPRPVDLVKTGTPSEKYLDFMLHQSLSRWLFRRRQPRPLGAGRFRLLQCAVLEVHRIDRRLRRLRNSGLHEGFLFRYDWGFGTKPSIPLFGSSLERVGSYTVTVNPAARPFLSERAEANSVE